MALKLKLRHLLPLLAALSLPMTDTLNAQTPFHDAPYLAKLSQWRTQRATGLAEPDGWLSLAALEWLQPGATTIGSAPDNKLRLEHAPAHLAVLHLTGNTVQLTAPVGGFPSGTTLDNKPAAEAQLSHDDNHPSELRSGSLFMFVIQRGDRLYLRVKDASSPARLHFHSLNWFAPNPQFTITAKWIPSGVAGHLAIPNVLGQVSEESSPGIAEFTLYGQVIRLAPIVEDPHPLFFIFRDATSKTSTYGAGRFLNTSLPSNGLGKPGTIVLDFNRAINPPCAYTPYATCPLPPQQNRLTIPIPAGEKRYHD